RLTRNALHRHRGDAAAVGPLADARLQMDGVRPEFRLAPGAVGPQGLDHRDLAGPWAHAALLQVLRGDALAGLLRAHVDHHRLAHYQPLEGGAVDGLAVGVEVPRRVDVGPDVGAE